MGTFYETDSDFCCGVIIIPDSKGGSFITNQRHNEIIIEQTIVSPTTLILTEISN